MPSQFSTIRYPAVLLEEYRSLVKKELNGTMTLDEAVRYAAVREQINAIDCQRSRPDTWDIQRAKLREELAQIRSEVEALPDAE